MDSRRENQSPDEGLEESDSPSNHELWRVAGTGLDEALIKSITVCKYKRGDGLIRGTDCSVCLGEFREDESVRLLPKCSHAFHVACIDTWLRSHSNCPLCRANVIFVNSSPLPMTLPLPLPPPSPEPPLNDDHHPPVEQSVHGGGDIEAGFREEEEGLQAIPKTQFPPPNQLGNSENVSDTIIDVGDQSTGRSVSMDCFSKDVEIQIEGGESGSGNGEMSKSSHRNSSLDSVVSPVAMKRSLSSGQFSLSRHGRDRNVVIPL